MTPSSPTAPPAGAHPRVLLAAAAAAFGEDAVVDWCCRLVGERERPDDPDLRWLGGSEDWPGYWCRVWGCRGLLYVWPPGEAGRGRTVDVVGQALRDEHWRVREMGLKVARARVLADLTGTVARLREDPNARVRAAAERALVALAAVDGPAD
ncbi:hypothetical protein [Ornithinicoccus hortensis]|uniref:HEAT repeat protein n=1 Tax=Ornithinicoccus hortensis TaxID=82346 RepID=A0A542YQA0_9MICO|nr:hypothetical protein [Ornithinicoccus hortensis]TQL50280.1 hypothetical protein FB467_1384 [Ornithinicoccus hortensis]